MLTDFLSDYSTSCLLHCMLGISDFVRCMYESIRRRLLVTDLVEERQ